jgi:hypothetical protein
MRAAFKSLIFGCCLVVSSACHPGALVETDPTPSVGGTLAGIVRSGTTPVTGRKVAAIDVTTGARFEATTGQDGGYSMKVPEGTYRLDVEIRSGETVSKRPGETHVNKSDLDAARDFEITGP